jgi:hypothetical protein
MAEQELKLAIAALTGRLKGVQTVFAITGDEVIRCLEYEGKSKRYIIRRTTALSPGESVAWSVPVPAVLLPGMKKPEEGYCVASNILPDSDLLYDVEYKVYTITAPKEEPELFYHADMLMELDCRLPIDFVFCEPRTFYRVEFLNNSPDTPAKVGFRLICNVVPKPFYPVIRAAILGQVFEHLRLQAEKLEVAWPRVVVIG